MAAEVLPTPLVRLPQSASAPTPDQRYWHTFSSQQLLPVPNSSPVTFLSTNSPASAPFAYTAPTPPTHYITVTTGPRLLLVSPQTLKTVRTIARTSSPFHGATVRSDGRLVLAGSDSGAIQAFDASSRAILKTWNEHKQPVWVANWHPTNLTASMSCSDDSTVRLWDLPSDESTWTGYGHTDYVRAGSFLGASGSLFVSGSYDQTVRVWDSRIPHGNDASSRSSCVQTFRFSSPVESVLPLPGSTTLAASCGPSVAILDLVAARPLHMLRNHQKTVTSLALGTRGTRLLAGGLDGHVKVFSTSDWTVVSGFKYPAAVLSLSVVASPNGEDRHVCVGTQSGMLSIRTKLSPTAKAAKKRKEQELDALAKGEIDEFDRKIKRKERREAIAKGEGWQRRIRGKDFVGESDDIIVSANAGRIKRSKAANQLWEKPLRAGDYAGALDAALDSRDKPTVLTVLTALVHRSALRAALRGRNAKSLMPVLKWTQRYISDVRCVGLATEVVNVLIDEYAARFEESPEVQEVLDGLHEEVRRSMEVAQVCEGTLGMLDMLKASGSGGGL